MLKVFLLIAFVWNTFGHTGKDLPVVFSEEVRSARGNIVALESTIISHGMPYPENLNTALEVQNIVRSHGAVPATIVIIEGVIHIGLNDDELTSFAQLPTSKVAKVSRRNLASIIAAEANGATTVAATSYLADLFGIKVFVTGGLGGVHRGVEQTMDISADLVELGRTPISVVCAGAKSILDLPRTLEYLETQGVSVIGFNTTQFPAFFSRESGLICPVTVSTYREAADIIHSAQKLQLKSGNVFAVPVPEDDALDFKYVEMITERVLEEVKSIPVSGKDVTPYFLKRITELTEGKSLKTNIALVKNNAKVGALIAVEYSKILFPKSSHYSDVFVVGGALCDVIGASKNKIVLETSNPGSIRIARGGVGMNIAIALSKMGVSTYFLSAVSDDSNSKIILSAAEKANLRIDGISIFPSHRTATYCAIEDSNNELVVGVSDTEIFKEISPEIITAHKDHIAHAKLVVFDGNIREETIITLCDIANTYNVPILFEPTSVASSQKILRANRLNSLSFISPNELELKTIACLVSPSSCEMIESKQHKHEIDKWEEYVKILLDGGVKKVIAKFGKRGVLFGESDGKKPQFQFVESPKVDQIVSVSGAGDSFISGFIFGFLSGSSSEASLDIGKETAKATLQSSESVSESISRDLVEQVLNNYAQNKEKLKKEL